MEYWKYTHIFATCHHQSLEDGSYDWDVQGTQDCHLHFYLERNHGNLKRKQHCFTLLKNRPWTSKGSWEYSGEPLWRLSSWPQSNVCQKTQCWWSNLSSGGKWRWHRNWSQYTHHVFMLWNQLKALKATISERFTTWLWHQEPGLNQMPWPFWNVFKNVISKNAENISEKSVNIWMAMKGSNSVQFRTLNNSKNEENLSNYQKY